LQGPAPGALLHNMCQFVCEQLSGCGASGCVLILSEHNVLSHRERLGRDAPGGICGPSVGVDTHLAEVVTEARLKKRPCWRIERLAGRR